MPYLNRDDQRRNKAQYYRTVERNRRLKASFGLTPEAYGKMLAKQGCRCAICRQLPFKRRLVVDHCHRTGKVRGLLCDGCNLSVGHLKESVTNAESLVRYLLLWQS